MTGTTVYSWGEIEGEQGGGVLRKRIGGEGASLRRVSVPAGSRAERHSHPHEQFLCVLEGAATLTTAEGSCALAPGVVVRFAPGAWHEAVFERDTVLLEVNVGET